MSPAPAPAPAPTEAAVTSDAADASCTRSDVAWAELCVQGQALRIEHQWLNRERGERPLLVFLHEGLGSLAMWRDFPQRLCAALGWRGLVYSRPGYGRSTPRPATQAWSPDFMHQQAQRLLPALLATLGVDSALQAPWLLGHSDGGSIALLHAAALPQRVAGAIVLAPHILVEQLSLASIAQARQAYLHGDLRQRLARYHDDPDSAFWGWNDVWLSPAFRDWTIADALPAIRCPLLAVQGLDDDYGTLEQIRGIASRVPQTQLLALPACGHSPQRDQPAALLRAVQAFVQAHSR